MLDENLPAFFLKPANDGTKHHHAILLSYHGSDPEPAYLLHHADPASPSPAHKNCYAAALFDAYNPDVLFGEVLARPGWTQPTLSQDEMRRNGGVPPPPQPVIPSEFTVQLYNPDQQVLVQVKEGKWGGSDSYEFALPETTFRTPSASTLDRGQSDPGSLAITPKINFAWRKEKLSKDLTCFMTGKSTDNHERKKSRRDPDIAVGLWRSMRELTIYEPNLGRVDVEDPKGLEVTLLLTAIVIKDLYFSSKERLHEIFNIHDAAAKLSSGGRKLSNPRQTHSIVGTPNPLQSHPVQQPTPNEIKRSSLPRLQTTPPQRAPASRPPPLADPRAQWELDAETTRLRAQADAEAKEAQRRRRDREKAEEAERRRLQKMVEEENREARRKAAEVDKETERLRRLYGVQAGPPQQLQRPMPNQRQQRTQFNLVPPAGNGPPRPPRLGSNGLYANPAASTSTVYMSGANQNAASSSRLAPPKPTKKKSFFGLRSASDDGAEGRRLSKKSSARW